MLLHTLKSTNLSKISLIVSSFASFFYHHSRFHFPRKNSTPIDWELVDASEPDSLALELSDLLSSDPEEAGCCMIIRGMFFKYSLRFSVMPPSPIEVKKLIANLMFFGVSLGKMDSNESCIVWSLRRSFSMRIPRCSDNSCTRIVKLTLERE